MFLIVGLGNPGQRYQHDRHNIGFDVVSRFAEKHNFPSWKSAFQGHITNHSLQNQKIFILKPQTYMNLSGNAVREVCNFYKIDPDHVLVVHDELDLPFSRLQLKKGGGEGGHNGLRSTSQELQTKQYIRLRFGIGKPENKEQEIADFVLDSFSSEELKSLPEMKDKAVQVIESYLFEGLQKAMNQWNKKPKKKQRVKTKEEDKTEDNSTEQQTSSD